MTKELEPEYQAFLDDIITVYEKHGLMLEWDEDDGEYIEELSDDASEYMKNRDYSTPKSRAEYHRKIIEAQYKHSVDEYNDKKKAMDELATQLENLKK